MHDLATVQSICGRRHQQLEYESCAVMEDEDAEEDFCQCSSDSKPMLLSTLRVGEATVPCWSTRPDEAWTHRLLCSDTEIEAMSIAGLNNAMDGFFVALRDHTTSISTARLAKGVLR